MGTGTLFTINPLSHANVKLIAVLTGATVVAFSFIGFDAITMYTEVNINFLFNKRLWKSGRNRLAYFNSSPSKSYASFVDIGIY